MTTIATNGKVMAADSLVTDGSVCTDQGFSKLRRLRSGAILGVCGSAFDIDPLASWLDGDRVDAPPTLWDKTEALILHVDGRVEVIDHQCRVIASPPVQALGSGMDIAFGAMDAGADPEKAVRIAMARDIHTGGALCWMKPGGAE